MALLSSMLHEVLTYQGDVFDNFIILDHLMLATLHQFVVNMCF